MKFCADFRIFRLDVFRLNSSEDGEQQYKRNATVKMDKVVFIGFNFDFA
jgi:predicted AlkP superfamily pyrophosphatase or phosphodiesterase